MSFIGYRFVLSKMMSIENLLDFVVVEEIDGGTFVVLLEFLIPSCIVLQKLLHIAFNLFHLFS